LIQRRDPLTLVVAQQKGTVIAAVCDTGITRAGMQLGPREQQPKVCILSKNIALGFSGSPDLAATQIGNFSTPTSDVFRATTDYFLSAHRKDDLDFLLLLHHPVAKIVKISDGRIYHPSQTAWIGDKNAFELFQRYRTEKTSGPAASRFEVPLISTTKESEKNAQNSTFDLIGALRYVLLDSSTPSVFGDVVAINNVEGHFEYRSYNVILDTHHVPLLLPRQVMDKLVPELEEIRKYSVSCFVTAHDASIQGVAVHFMHGKLTHLYWGRSGGLLSNARVIVGKNIEEVFALTKAELGIASWIGQIMARVPPDAAYGIPKERWKISVKKN
jgi:hypothetical protein